MMKMFLKILACAIVAVIAGYLILMLSLSAFFWPESRFRVPFLIIILFLIVILVPLAIFRVLKPKMLAAIFIPLFGLCGLIIGVDEIVQTYNKSFIIVNEKALNLWSTTRSAC
jgi:hypothetical protein